MKNERQKISITFSSIFSSMCFPLVLTLALFILIFAPVFAPAYAGESEDSSSFKPGLHLKLTGGFTQSTIGDMNDHLNSMNKYLVDYYGQLATGQIKTLNTDKSDFQFEVLWDLSQKFKLGVATSIPARYRQESTFQASDPENEELKREITVKPEIKAWIPLKVSLYYSVYSNSTMDVSAYTGLILFSAKMSEEQTFESDYPDETVLYNNKDWVADRDVFAGWQGGVSLEYGLGKNLSIVADFEGRLARNSSMKGKMVYTLNNSPDHIGDVSAIYASGYLYYFGSANSYYDLAIDTPVHFDATGLPSPGTIDREARLDLSGFSFRVGLRLRLF